MSELFKAFERFVFRDLSFLLGGSVVLGGIFHIFNRLPSGDVPAFNYFVWAGISYAIGYSVQEVFTLAHIVRTKAALAPNFVGRLLYLLFDRKRAKPINATEYEKAKKWLYETAPERFRLDYERIESLKQIGTALGPCFLLAGSILIWKESFNQTEFEYVASRGLFVLGLILILLGWLKVTQQPQYLIARYNALKGESENNHK